MIALISGSNRPACNSLKVARIAEAILTDLGQTVQLLNLQDLPPEVMSPDAYENKPEGLAPFQDAILEADGILTVVAEYNGSFPGALKMLIDMLRFPESLVEKKSAFIGIAAGRWGGLRSVEQLEMVFQYRHAHLFGRRVFIPNVYNELDGEGQLKDPELVERLSQMLTGFVEFCR